MANPIFLLAVLGLNVALSEWLVRRTALRHLGSALLVIVLTALAANSGLIPTYSEDIAVYAGTFEYLAPLAIFLLLLQVNLRRVLQAGLPMLLLFAIGAVGTVTGVLAGMWAVGGSEAFGEHHFALGGMFVGTYTGGSINFNAVALEYGVVKNGLLYAGAAAVDSAMTTVWMAVTVFVPRFLARLEPRRELGEDVGVTAQVPQEDDTETVNPLDLALLLALGAAAVWLSLEASAWLEARFEVAVPSILILTTFALGLAQLPLIQRLRGARLCGWLAVMLFLAVIGALCDLGALGEIGALGRSLMVFVVVVVLVHGVIVFGSARLLGFDSAMAAVASQANIGGSTSALALARSLDRGDLVLPGILIGALGNGAGTYLGFATAAWLS